MFSNSDLSAQQLFWFHLPNCKYYEQHVNIWQHKELNMMSLPQCINHLAILFGRWRLTVLTIESLKLPGNHFELKTTGLFIHNNCLVCQLWSGPKQLMRWACYSTVGGQSWVWKWHLSLQGWTYGFNGALIKATRIKGIKNFNVNVCQQLCGVLYLFLYLQLKLRITASFWFMEGRGMGLYP